MDLPDTATVLPSPPSPPSPPPRPRLSVAAVLGVPLGGLLFLTWFWVSLGLLVSGVGGLLALGAGVLLLIPWALLMRLAVGIERRRAVAVHRIDVIVPRRRRTHRTGPLGALHQLLLDLGSGAFWRGVLHHHVALLVAGGFFLLAVTSVAVAWTSADIALRVGELLIGSFLLPRWALGLISLGAVLAAIGLLVLGGLADRGIARAMISGSEDDLRDQVVEMTVRRQGAVDAAAQERLRIERDLHDGVQPRLVALAMTLGRARGMIRTDPDRATELVTRAHGEAKAVMTDLRQLARGIHPAVLTDRGLDAALSALAARSAVPVDLTVDLPRPVDREREAVAYFVVAEALTNIAKHSGAHRARVIVDQSDGPAGPELRLLVEDDGRGGATVRRDGVSTGLAGLSDRVRATGVTLSVGTPATGGTALRAVLPLAAPAGAAAPAPAVADPAGRPVPTLEVPR